jgi:hypothetical protein
MSRCVSGNRRPGGVPLFPTTRRAAENHGLTQIVAVEPATDAEEHHTGKYSERTEPPGIAPDECRGDSDDAYAYQGLPAAMSLSSLPSTPFP